MIVVRPIPFDVSVISLRSKVSHSWLDHEVAMVSTRVAVERWRTGSWNSIVVRWNVLRELAETLGASFSHFGASSLVNLLPLFGDWSDLEKETLKHDLDRLHVTLPDFQATVEFYRKHLDSFWKVAELFFEETRSNAASEQSVAEAWAQVLQQGKAFKEVFDMPLIPDGIALP